MNKSWIKDNIAHLLLLIIGGAVMLCGCFQNSLWFDEAYTVGLVGHSLPSLIKWATFDVHPHLYYIGLKLFTLIFGNTMYAMRVFSVIGGILFASVGITHIKKDFGKEVGFWYSFCALFCASTLTYALQIRMYTWGAYFVTLAAIYALRSINNPDDKKSGVCFLIFSISAAYTHYFALFAIATINVVMLVYNVKNKIDLKKWWKNAAIQICSYIPGALVFLIQIMQNGADWIRINYPDLVFDLTSYHVLGDLAEQFVGYKTLKYFVISGILLLLYVIGAMLLRNYYKSDRISLERKQALKSAVAVYFGVILFALTVSLFRIIYYIRYTVVISGLLFFMMALLICSFRSKKIRAMIGALMLIIFIQQGTGLYKTLYHPSADSVTEAMDSVIDENDDFLFDDFNCYVVTVRYPDARTIFYNPWHWNINKAYKAFGKESYIVDDFSELSKISLGNRVWVTRNSSCHSYLLENGYSESTSRNISTEYHNYNFELVLLVK